ncbi:NifU family protein [Anaerovorax odorimutans]|uniref:NifU family protein n=1 Tax=Anaerovorax odorimutans TaxID=109327 RepID=A0ABT1RLE9_9FIRM|nr:NifU family protein [Anaerovorax odorimutans]
MREQIEKVLKEKVDPVLAEHYGGATLTGFENNVAKVRLTGACASCPSAQYTIEDVVKNIVMENCEGVKDVILDTSVSEDLLDMAKKILRK